MTLMQPTTAGHHKGAPEAARGARAPKRVSVLGATGSVGANTLRLIGTAAAEFEIVALTAQSNSALLARQAIQHNAKLAVVGDDRSYADLKDRLAGTGIEAAAGRAALIAAAERPADCVMAAMVGAAGLEPALAAARQGRRLALANKECLVCAGAIFMRAVARHGTELLPVDSEHSAAFQAMAGNDSATIEKIVLTASGGPFRTWEPAALAAVTPAQALKHPNWSMGRKISIDSATFMNKALELIEAFHLFPVSAAQLDVVVHPQSIVHCLVFYIDGSVMAQLACPDMCTPIALSLAWPSRMPAPTQRLDLAKLSALTFEAPDPTRFPALSLGRAALQRGGLAPAFLNAANEIAVQAFLDGQIGFLDIATAVADCIEAGERRGLLNEVESVSEVLQADQEARAITASLLASRA